MHARLKDLGVTRDAIDFVLDKSERRVQVRNAVLGEKVRSLTAQLNEQNAQATGSGVVNAGGANAEGSRSVAERLTDVRDEIVDTKAMLTTVTHRVEGLANDRSEAELSERLTEVRDQLLDARGALALLADRLEGKADGHALAGLSSRLGEVSEQMAEATRAQSVTTRQMGERVDAAISEWASAFTAAQGHTRQILWVLAIGVGAIAPTVVVLLALTIWSMVAG